MSGRISSLTESMQSFLARQGEEGIYVARQFLPKGRYLRKRCAQFKTIEIYTKYQPRFTEEINKVASTDIRTICVPSFECLQYLSEQLVESRPYWDVSSRSLIILQSVLRHFMDTASSREIRSLSDLIQDFSTGNTAVFFNEFDARIYVPQERGTHCGTIINHQHQRQELFVKSVLKLKEYLNLVNIVILISSDNDPISRIPGMDELQLITMGAILDRAKLHRGIAAGKTLESMQLECNEILEMRKLEGDEKKMKNASIYRSHLPYRDIERGLKEGYLYKGSIVMERGNSSQADVILERNRHLASSDAISIGTVRIGSRVDINRAMNGDKVVIKLCPRNKWVPWTSGSSRLEHDDDDIEATHCNSDAEGDQLLPTGEVVGLLETTSRNREIVAFMPKSDNRKTHLAVANASLLGREEFVLVSPCDRTLPRLRVSTRQSAWLRGKKVLVRIDGWRKSSEFPDGHVIRCLGDSSDFGAEINAILMEHSIYNRAFSLSALACLPPVPVPPPIDTQAVVEVDCSNPDPSASRKPWIDSQWVLPDHLCQGRKDFRTTRTVISVDPKGCQDIDDAMHVQWLRPGVIEVGVHIADVCAFVEQGSALDIEAQRRGTTVYLTHCRIDMLPSLLSSDIASLHGQKDRLAVSTLWEINVWRPDGEPAVESDFSLPISEFTTSTWYKDFRIELPEDPCWCGRSIIKSVAAMTYEQADQLICDGLIKIQPDDVPLGQAGRPVSKDLWTRLTCDTRALTLVSRSLLRRREASGSVNFNQGDDGGGELTFVLKGSPQPEKVEAAAHLEVHDTIAELMILANGAVAKIITEALPLQALVRVHAPPPLHKLESIRDFCDQIGLGIFQSPNAIELTKQIPKFHKLLSEQVGRSTERKKDALGLMTSVLIRAMSEALYVSTGSLSGDLIFPGDVAVDEGSGTEKSSVLVGEEVGGVGFSNFMRRGHYGLGMLHYTHFTSPIRRYADIVVHRQLLYALDLPSIASRFNPELTTIKICAADINLKINDSIEESKEEVLFQEHGGVGEEADLDVDDFMDSLLGDVGDELLPAVSTGISLSEQKPHSAVASSNYADAIKQSLSDELLSNEKASGTTNILNIENDEILKNPPYSGSELFKIANSLNTLHRNSKWAQADCQKLFLSFYFRDRIEEHSAVIYSVKENGVQVYIPNFDFRGRVFVASDRGVVQLHKNLLADLNPKYLAVAESANDEEIVMFSDYTSEVVRIDPVNIDGAAQSTDSISILRIRKITSPEDIMLELKPLQKVNVLMSGAVNQDGSSDIRILLSGIVLESARDSQKNAVSKTLKHDVTLPFYNEGRLRIAEKPDTKCKADLRSAYECISFCMGKIESMRGEDQEFRRLLKRDLKRYMNTGSKPLKLQTEANPDATMAKVSPNSAYKIKGTGRLCFGNLYDYDKENGDEFVVSEMFVNNSVGGAYRNRVNGQKLTSTSSSGQQKKGSGFLTGRNAAIAKMKQWGEEWADEEDLPDNAAAGGDEMDEGNDELFACDEGDSDNAHGLQIGGGANFRSGNQEGHSSSYNYGKEVALATQRQNKLKVAKRNSKFG